MRLIGVLGPHQSGGSATAALLALLGRGNAALDASSVPGGALRNDDFDRPVAELNDAILETLGGTAWDPPELPSGWELDPALDSLKKRAGELLSSRSEGGAPLLCDPRLSLTAPLWRQLAGHAVFVFCLRSPLEAIGDLVRRESESLTWHAAATLWLRYGAAALEQTLESGGEILFYEDYVADFDSQLGRLAHIVGAPKVPASAREHLDQWLGGDWNGRATSALEVAQAGEVLPEARGFFLAVRAARALPPQSDYRPEDGQRRADSTLGAALEHVAPELWGLARERQEVAETREAAAEARRERDAARRAERGYRAQLDRAREQLAAAVEMQEAPLREAEERVRLMREREQDLERELRRERKKRQSLENSMSWRLTRPLRAGKTTLAARRRTDGSGGDSKSTARND